MAVAISIGQIIVFLVVAFLAFRNDSEILGWIAIGLAIAAPFFWDWMFRMSDPQSNSTNTN